MFTVRTPLRVSLFGGGTDYPDWFREHPGAVLGFTIDKYIYISALPLSAFVEYRYRLSYSRVEMVQHPSEIQHPVMREILVRESEIGPLDCSIQADLPANAGLGSSSAFTVGFLNLVSAIRGISRTKMELARLAISFEQDILHERVGVQDQLHATYGGLNRFDLLGDRFTVAPVHVGGADLDGLADWMLLVFTGLKRHASETLDEQLDNTVAQKVDPELHAMVALVDEAQRVFEGCRGDALPRELARLLEETWALKKRLSSRVSNAEIDALYERCLREGALAGKLLGAGGGGFLLVIVPPDRRAGFIEALGRERCVEFRVAHEGSAVQRLW